MDALAAGLLTSVGGAVIGVLAQSAVEARKAKRDLEEADTNDVLRRLAECERMNAVLDDRTKDTRRNP